MDSNWDEMQAYNLCFNAGTLPLPLPLPLPIAVRGTT
jgi:hypothetical protein